MSSAQFGIGRLDDLFHGLLWGENIVWALADGPDPAFVSAVIDASRAANPDVRVFRAGDGRLTAEDRDLGLDPGRRAVYVIDLTGAGEDDLAALVRDVAGQVFRGQAVAHWLARGQEDPTDGLAQCVITVEKDHLRIDRADARPSTIRGVLLPFEIDAGGRLEVGPTSAAALLGRGIRALRKDRHWSQSQVGALIGVSGSAISQAERGQHALSLESVLELSEKTGIPLDRLLRDTPASEVFVHRPWPADSPGVLVDDPRHGVRMASVTVPPRGSATPPQAGHGSCLLLVAAGYVRVVHSSSRFVLRQGDALRVTEGSVLSIRNIGDTDALVFCVSYG
ncbi:helix-turn-helix domain-containing protein [Nonomuraea zeae]|uniref:Helix-turn-helix domain-containing protein n=1 Tax=Nonomuraea zeae TaxID=1642303 RepID=A0A5S4GSM8_9ACTN|nr:helix-turn-helix domain-containing protein [Nonomuraea zeae]TMR35958.1 helix-turn-helix domain-containing protein [Nonomuraea zeae]